MPTGSVITGGSAGGYTTLMALTRNAFAGGASHFGVSDVAALARDTHKFESRYMDWLVAPLAGNDALYRERSPLTHADKLKRPVIFFQGDEDKVVPPNQTEMMVDALRRNGVPTATSCSPASSTASARVQPDARAGCGAVFLCELVFRTPLAF